MGQQKVLILATLGSNFISYYYGNKRINKRIQQLPINKRMLVIERTLKFIRESELKKKMEKAVDSLLNDYRTDKELTVFTNIDFDNFYEVR